MRDRDVERLLRRHAPPGPSAALRPRILAAAGWKPRRAPVAARLAWAFALALILVNITVGRVSDARYRALIGGETETPLAETPVERLARDFGEPMIARLPSAFVANATVTRVPCFIEMRMDPWSDSGAACSPRDGKE